MSSDATDDLPTVEWADAYARLRRAEGRILADDVVARLPDVGHNDPSGYEWRCRAASARRLVTYVRGRRPCSIVELGCGNGWLAHRLATATGAEVTGIDACAVELDQARRVFGTRANLTLVLGNFLAADMRTQKPDLVVLASAMQYVAEPAALLDSLLGSLAPGGEVHVLDSPIYDRDEADDARVRSARYFESHGIAEMSAVYQHHHWGSFGPHPYDVLYRPRPAPVRRVARHVGVARSPFPWLRFGDGGGR
jgi:SAM-dependent methyltransferase